MITRRAVLEGAAGGMMGLQRAAASPSEGLLSAAFIARRGRRAARRVSGMALTPRGFEPFSVHHPFRVASVSKMISAFALITLIERAGVSLDGDISALLGWRLRHPAYPHTPISLRMLLTHTSGLRNGIDFPVPFNRSLQERLTRAALEPDYAFWFAPPERPPGTDFAYSDTNFALAAQAGEALTGVRFDRLMRETVLAPARLDAGYNWSGVSQHKRRRAAAGCRWRDGAWRAEVDAAPPEAPDIAVFRAPDDQSSMPSDYRLGQNGFAFAPHGGLRLSLSDMDALARVLAAAPQTRRQGTPHWTFTPTTPNGDTLGGLYQAYGLGMQAPLGSGRDRFFGESTPDWRGHFGDAYGWMTGLWWNVRAGASLVYAINGMPEHARTESPDTALTAAEQTLINQALHEIGLA